VAAPDPELDVLAAALAREGARFVVIGDFAVIANRHVRATEDVHILVPEDAENDRRVIAALGGLDGVRHRDDEPLRDEHLLDRDHLRARTAAGLVDVVREGPPPLDVATVERHAIRADYGGVEILLAGLRSIVAFKRLSDRPLDRSDLASARSDPRRAPDRPGSRARPVAAVGVASQLGSGPAAQGGRGSPRRDGLGPPQAPRRSVTASRKRSASATTSPASATETGAAS
jgi:hypothetical protein